MADIRFQSIEDGDLAPVLWYAMAGQALRYPDHFKSFTDALLNELLERRGKNAADAWLEDRFREIHSAAEAVQVDLNIPVLNRSRLSNREPGVSKS